MKTLRLFLSLFFLTALVQAAPKPTKPRTQTAIFAGGCFWCMAPPFEQLPGVVEVLSGYTDGKGPDPNYRNYQAKGHTEAVKVTYDPAKVTYEKLLEVFWMQINPTDANGQFVDRGPGYRAGIYYLNGEQEKLAEKSKADLGRSGRFDKPILTEIKKATAFYPAEDYHQGYHRKNPGSYKMYRKGSGRDGFLEKVWGKGKQ